MPSPELYLENLSQELISRLYRLSIFTVVTDLDSKVTVFEPKGVSLPKTERSQPCGSLGVGVVDICPNWDTVVGAPHIWDVILTKTAYLLSLMTSNLRQV